MGGKKGGILLFSTSGGRKTAHSLQLEEGGRLGKKAPIEKKKGGEISIFLLNRRRQERKKRGSLLETNECGGDREEKKGKKRNLPL